LILEFIKNWEEGYKVVCAIKNKSHENPVMFLIRKIFYSLLSASAEGEILHNFTGFGLYDRQFIDALRKYNDPYPFLRGLVTEIGFNRVEVPYTQKERKFGKSSFNFFSYYDYAMTGFVNHTKLPLRLAVFTGFILAMFSFLIALVYFIYKILYWDTFTLGLAPMVIGLFFFSAIQLIFIGVIGEYLGAVWTQVKHKPLVIEEERINFDD
jgi:glycosyltransferase involved in cell wall biosynthesis